MCGLDKTKIVLTGPFNSSSNQNYVGTKFSCLKYDLQCTKAELDKIYNTTMYSTCDQQRHRSVHVSTHNMYIKQPSWIVWGSKKVHRSAKGLMRMCCCSRTVYPALDSPAIKGKYDQRMLLSECAVAQTEPSLCSSHKMFC